MTKTALICDDDRTLSRIMQHVLAKKGFAVRAAENGKDALELLKEGAALMLLDLEMPEKDGFGVLSDMKAGAAARPYVIVLTANEDQATHARVKALGADELWTKPFNAGELLEKVEGLMAQGKI